MVRRILGAMAITVLSVAAANAQDPFQAKFQFTGGGSGVPIGFDFGAYTGKFISPSNPAQTFEPNGLSFQVWCVDPEDYVYVGEQSNPWVTYLSGSNFSKTLVGDQTRYLEAAWLANQLFGTTINAGDENLEYAMWELMGYSTINDAACAGGLISACPNYNATTVGSNMSNAIANYTSLTFNQWSVITAPNQQELLYFHEQGPPEDLVPEPATMSLVAMGLVGLAGVPIKRRKRNG
ncbi:MAG: PEP-CTERM sorting domain-containing protein [Gemmatimonadales bacterium]